MTEKHILLDAIDPLEFYGPDNRRLNLLKESFPDIKFVGRGENLKISGEEVALERLEELIGMIVEEIDRVGTMDEQKLEELLSNKTEKIEENVVILHGSRGNIISPRTAGQRKIYRSAGKNDLVFATGPAGTGKTYLSVAIAVKALKEKQVKKIVLTRPAVEAGENLGFLPGDLKEKVDPYLRPLYDALQDMYHSDKLKSYLEKDVIEIVPLAYMRGRTLENAFVIMDEAQNATEMQLKMFLTRLGKDSKAIINGDHTQVDLPRNQRSGLIQALRILRGVKGIGFVTLTTLDVVRHKLVKKIIEAYDKEEKQSK